MYHCAICWENNLFSQSLVLIKSLYSFTSLISKHVLSLVSFTAWVKVTTFHTFEPNQNCICPQKHWARPLGLALLAMSQHKHLLWCLEMESACRSEVTRLENTYFIWWCREACRKIEWQKCCYFVNSKDYMIFTSPESDSVVCPFTALHFFPSMRQLHHDVLDEQAGNEGGGKKIIIYIQKWELKRSSGNKI